MAIPYELTRVLTGERTTDLEALGDVPKEKMVWLLQDNNMEGQYLGECLDKCRWGSMSGVMWETGVEGMVNFVQSWFNQNPNNFTYLFHERDIDELYDKFELPHINLTYCPREGSHRGTFVDLGGKVRCSHKEEKLYKPSYLIESKPAKDKLSGMQRISFYQDDPLVLHTLTAIGEDISDEVSKENEQENKRKIQAFDNEEATMQVIDPCYAIMSDIGQILSLEEVFNRVKIKGNLDTRNHFEVRFDGWDLAYYVQRWYEQGNELEELAQPFMLQGEEFVWGTGAYELDSNQLLFN